MFASIQDHRNGGNTRHHFGEILFIAFAAVLCGVRNYELMEGFAELRQLDPGYIDPQSWSFAQTKDNGHDLSETRQIMVRHDLNWMDPAGSG